MRAEVIWLALAAYLLAGIVVAAIARRNLARGVESFYLGGRALGGVVSALSYSATTFSAFMMLGLAGLTYTGGVGALGFELIYLAGLSLVAIFGPRFWLVGRRFGYITPSEMIGDRYESRPLAVVMALMSCLFLVPYSAVQLMGIGYLLSGTTGGDISFATGVAIGAGLAVLWTLVAGLRSVAWTDALQALIMVVGGLLAVGFVVYSLGGLGSFIGQLEADHGAKLAVPGPGLFRFETFVALTLPWFFFSISNPQVSQRLFTTESLAAMRTMIIGFLVFGFVFTLISIVWGLSALLLVPDLDNPDMATPSILASGALPPWLALVLIIGVLAAAVSTIDSIVLTLASMVSRDVFRHAVANSGEASQLLVGKIVIVVMVALAAMFASLQVDLISLLSVASSAGLLVTVPAIVGAFFWRRGTAAGALSSMVAGGLLVTWWQFGGVSPLGVPAAVMALCVAIVIFVGVSLATSAPKAKARAFIDDIRVDLDRRNIS
ncbi:sodium:solute symporter family protein [Fodinicurvata sp. EGI_FJ10296]|uniref:sodium:solute symporter family protein n=1 Tax=Fodinicurvata sp. EGI_FJ10296 TaxID=3231908 RepID=UPI0034553CEC